MRPDKIDPDEIKKERNLHMINLGLSLIVQIIILCIYYFEEKQTLLTFPMILGIFVTFTSLFRYWQQTRWFKDL